MEFENSITIAKPLNEVFAYLADLSRLPEWNYAIQRTTQQTPGPTGLGTQYLQERSLPRPMTEKLEITEYTPFTTLQISGGFGPFSFGVSTYRLEQTEGGLIVRNHMRLTANGVLPLIAQLRISSIKAAVAQNLTVLKSNIESQY